MKFRRILMATSAVFLAVAAALPAKADDTIRVLSPVWSGFAPVMVAQDLGYYKKEGLNVSVTFEDDVPTIMAALNRGDIDMAMFTVGEYQDLPKGLTGGTIIGEVDESLGGDGTVADGSIKTAADLKGKILAESPTLPAMLLLQMDLKKAGLSLKDVQLRESEAGDAVAIFSNKEVAAVATSEPQMSQTVQQNPQRHPHIISSSAEYPGYVVDIIEVRTADLKAHPEKYVKLLTGMYQATAYFEKDQAGFAKLAAPHYSLSTTDFLQSLKGVHYIDYQDAVAALGKPGSPGALYNIFNTIMELNLENGAATQKLSAVSSIDNSIIAKVTPEAVKQ
ncbi:ABC transporter substrate-binding protein [Acidocella aminolytica]|uniref:Pyrimidine moiety biosynthesis of thiamine NMT1/THI5 n=1 Tax=Acidocella aminolytica 101 = DSM 11237 TaxID=1120923 RepID=A0A0D6PHM1_9PROT|nr:ABC transporter substrate-binding protein [Acidocella aminolytica]GAN80334.1 pyrimidine moiety biosynthesis of thiamine NMT1/THI5 [Acidocella aminolytica 101 = DSM 11237]GBQ42986.1 nitrate/sulfonate/bicarbonate ABC transporter substrate-binding periplasmic protein [Acidocella aminolytica 101 = DSM 11237]SHE30012.1 NitT/TauT family transport system substrate-binding protein [Acidocella aminolytica 101 = DSM 11237]